MKSVFKKSLPHIYVLAGLFLVLFIYFKPAFDGKILPQNDVFQGIAAGHEVSLHRVETGEEALWSNSMFGGMPMYVTNVYYSGDWTHKITQSIRQLFPRTVSVIAVNFVCAYIMLLCFRVSPYISAIGAFAFAFSVFTILSAEAGHIFKVLAIGYMPLVIGGIRLVLNRKYLLGGSLTALAVGLEISSQHYQITYYLALFAALYVIIHLAIELKEKNFKHSLLLSLTLVFASVIGAGPNLARIWSIVEYNKYSTRGIKELLDTSGKENKKQGLDKDYAFAWSQGSWETLTLAVPYLYGGASGENIGEKSELAKQLKTLGVPRNNIRDITQQAPTYWGDQPFTGGPVYAGISIIFLAILGFITCAKKERMAIGISVLFLTLIALGKNFESFNYFMFDYFPMFNKFRTVSMSLSLTVLGLVLLAGIGLNNFLFKEGLDKKQTFYLTLVSSLVFIISIGVAQYVFIDYQSISINQKQSGFPLFMPILLLVIYGAIGFVLSKRTVLIGNIKNTDSIKKSAYALLALSYIIITVAAVSTGIRENAISTDKDIVTFQRMFGNNVSQSVLNDLVDAIRSDRHSMFVSSWFRSMLFIGLTAIALYLYHIKIIKDKVLVSISILAIVAIDLLTVDVKYLNHSKFTEKGGLEKIFVKNTSDNYILTDAKDDPNYRVFDLSNPFNNSMPAYYHKLVGGYSGLKLQRFQDVIDSTLRREEYFIRTNLQNLQAEKIPFDVIKNNYSKPMFEHLSILNMLNTKYVMIDYNGNVLKNDQVLGNAWFVDSIKNVRTPQEEIEALQAINPSTTAIVNSNQFPQITTLESKNTGSIHLTNYQPNQLRYTSNTTSERLAVFSEIYYSEGWKATIDGKEAPIVRCNYILRGLVVPAGKHEIVFTFKPNSYVVGNKISLAFSIVLFSSLFVALFFEIKNQTKSND